MTTERARGPACGPPFPVHPDLVERLLAAHPSDDSPRDEVAAHALATCAGYAYSDLDTVSTIAGRLGMEESACVRVSQVVDAMMVFSTAYLVQSRCGRVVILCYRGTEPGNLGNWLGDMDTGSDSMALGGQELRVPAGFHRNVRATRWAVLQELGAALAGRSLLDRETAVERPMEALYVAGHSLGGAMAVLFALALAGSAEHAELAGRLRAVYTFGQPLTATEPFPPLAEAIGRRLFRHVIRRDPIPALPPNTWGRFAHLGREYRHEGGGWRESAAPVEQLPNLREVPRALFAVLAGAKRRESAVYSMAEHAPHRYIAALHPKGRVTELGDRR